ncbi:MAG TPA: AAA family ATPase, partial [Pseudonocardiaceae bacterium]|nr:AAA family ATPase [Pseudonocardiaceae bacterium]
MRIESVTAHAFGPLREQTLHFAEAMTVIVGNNESAKSSWHAATFAAVCGLRRGKGRRGKDDQRFADLHKPWDSDEWRVSALIVLDDARRIELHHDLVGRIDCSARDELGRDVSSEIIHDGAPDGSRWLGLDRASFAATACVAQTQLLRVLDEASALQTYLQRAAATAGAEDTTTAAALERLEKFSAERVGTEHANSGRRPLQATRQARDTARRDLERAQAAHADYLDQLERVDRLRGHAERTQAMVIAHEAAVARIYSDRLTETRDRAQELYALYGDTAPSSPAEQNALTRQVDEALATWHAAPTPDPTVGTTRAQAASELAQLPAAPDGDVQAHSSVMHAQQFLHDARIHLRALDSAPPTQPPSAFLNTPAGDDELLELARALELPPSPQLPVDDTPPHPVHSATHGDSSSRRTAGVPVVALGGLITVLAVALALLIALPPVITIGVVVLGVGLMATGGLIHRGTTRHVRLHDSEPAAVIPGSVLDAVRTHTAHAELRREQASTRCRDLTLPADPRQLRQMPVDRAQARVYQQWQNQRTELNQTLTHAAAELTRALRERGQATCAGDTTPTDLDALEDSADRYRSGCQDRAGQAARAGLRDSQATRLADLDASIERDQRTRANAGRLVLAAAHACGLIPDPDCELAAVTTAGHDQATGSKRIATPAQAGRMLGEWS